MKVAFLTTATADCDNHVRAFRSFWPAEHVTFDHTAISNDWLLLEKIAALRPDVVLYIGAVHAPGNPALDAFVQMRKLARLVCIVSDAADHPWPKAIQRYRDGGCFDLYVSIDGAKGPVDLATLTPVDPAPFQVSLERDIRCGFSGTIGRFNPRSEIVNAMRRFITLRARDTADQYVDHVRFLNRCRMVLNASFTGSGEAHHIKGRVLEAGWAGCCLLEHADSPIGEWFPSDCYLSYRDAVEAAEIIRDTADATIARTAARLAAEVQGRFSARTIYSEMLARVGLPLALAA